MVAVCIVPNRKLSDFTLTHWTWETIMKTRNVQEAMWMKKQILAGLLAIWMVLTLAACGGKTDVSKKIGSITRAVI